MNNYTVQVTILADSEEEAKGIVERGIDKQGIAVTDLETMQLVRIMEAYLQDADGNERTLDVTEPDPADGTYCVHMDDQGQSWIRIVPEPRHDEDKLGGVVEAAIDKAMDDNDWITSMSTDPSISQNHVDDVFQALESYVVDHLARITK